MLIHNYKKQLSINNLIKDYFIMPHLLARINSISIFFRTNSFFCFCEKPPPKIIFEGGFIIIQLLLFEYQTYLQKTHHQNNDPD